MREIKIKRNPEIKTTSENIKQDEKVTTPSLSSVKSNNENFNRNITIRLNALLLETVKNIITSNKAGGDYRYSTVSDIIRAALEAYKNGMQLIALVDKGGKRETSFRVPPLLQDFYSNLPDNAKNEIVERAVRTFIKYQI